MIADALIKYSSSMNLDPSIFEKGKIFYPTKEKENAIRNALSNNLPQDMIEEIISHTKSVSFDYRIEKDVSDAVLRGCDEGYSCAIIPPREDGIVPRSGDVLLGVYSFQTPIAKIFDCNTQLKLIKTEIEGKNGVLYVFPVPMFIWFFLYSRIKIEGASGLLFMFLNHKREYDWDRIELEDLGVGAKIYVASGALLSSC